MLMGQDLATHMNKNIHHHPHTKRGALLRISVHEPGGKLYQDTATILLYYEGTERAVDKAVGPVMTEIEVKPGAYEFEVKAQALEAPRRRVEVGPNGKTASAYLGEPGWPFYRLGENVIPFLPRPEFVAVAFPTRKLALDEAARLGGEILNELPLKAVRLPEPERRDDQQSGRRKLEAQAPDFVNAGGAIWLFQLSQEPIAELRQSVVKRIRAIAGKNARIGMPVDLIPGQLKIVDNRFVTRFRRDIKREDVRKIVDDAGGNILRTLKQAPNLYLVDFPDGDLFANLARIEDWHSDQLLVYGEPDIIAEITDDVFPATPPNDPTFANQDNLTLQQVDVAWRIMRTLGADRTTGRPSVHVATLDRGVQLNHPDIGGNLTDGTPQISRAFDFSGMREMSVAGYAPDGDHGMGVYGIIAARTDNGEDISGIAPNTHQIAMERPSLTSANYADILLWAAGFVTGNDTEDWPAEPLSPAADIISCSHGENGLALSGIMDDTLQELANNGRGGLGTVVIYSAGNDNSLITGFRTWAAHPDTLAIANSLQPDGGGVERKAGTSNFGPEIDVAAQGAGAPSLDDNSGEQAFGGTSASAPTVAGIVALMLSKTPTLTFDEVRTILRNTAVQIDPDNVDPVGQWVDGFSQWYGFGRVDAASAVCSLELAVLQQTPSINFNDIPEGETTVRAAVFEVTGCQPATLEITDGPGADFATPLGIRAELDVSGDANRQARIWISYTGTTDGDTAAGSITVTWIETGQEFEVPITANTVRRPTVCVELVLDQSGSMTFGSGIPELPQRVDVLKFSVPPLLEVIHDDNALGIVRFDHDPFDAMPITVAGPPVFGAGRAAARAAVDAHTPNPAGNTAIGDGVERAHDHLVTETGFDIQAMIVFTDGHETASKYISEVADLINERVYAIGLGTADQIQPTALTALTSGTGGYLLLTGDLGGTDYFLLSKYYLQILAGVSNEDIVLDPQGAILPGQSHRLPFRLTEADISTDAILLATAPDVIRFSLETPKGDLITPGIGSGLAVRLICHRPNCELLPPWTSGPTQRRSRRGPMARHPGSR